MMIVIWLDENFHFHQKRIYLHSIKKYWMQKSLIVFNDGFKPLGRLENLLNEARLSYYASDIFMEFGFSSVLDFQEAVQKTFKVLNMAKIPTTEHIRIIFRDQNHQIFQDWKLSNLAYHLIKINGTIDNQNVVDYQIKIFSLLKT